VESDPGLDPIGDLPRGVVQESDPEPVAEEVSVVEHPPITVRHHTVVNGMAEDPESDLEPELTTAVIDTLTTAHITVLESVPEPVRDVVDLHRMVPELVLVPARIMTITVEVRELDPVLVLVVVDLELGEEHLGEIP